MSGLELLLTPENAVTFATLTFLEIVLAGDNLVLIAILSSRLPERRRPLARRVGLLAAVATRVALLVSLFWLAHIRTPLPLGGLAITPHQIVFGIGGAFLLVKALAELWGTLFGRDGGIDPGARVVYQSFLWVIVQIAFFDIVFSLDSVVAAIGIARHVEIMIAAILAAALVMLVLVNPISEFIERHRIVKVAALDLLVLIGAFLLAGAFDRTLPKVELYVAFVIVLVLQAILLALRALPAGLRYALVVAGMIALAALAVVFVSDNALARSMFALWDHAMEVLTNAVESIQRLLPAAKP